MGLKKPITSTLKPVSCMYWTQTAQRAAEYIPTYPIYNHSSFCMPKKALPPSGKKGMAQDSKCRTCWCYLSTSPLICSCLHRLPGSAVSASSAAHPAHTSVPQQLLPGGRAVFKKQFPAEKYFFFKETKWRASWRGLFTGNNCESSFATHQEGL